MSWDVLKLVEHRLPCLKLSLQSPQLKKGREGREKKKEGQ